ncbi:hypothetical protein NDU88_005829 [Pleurodeles waltl]|uniref:Uncharacterized protein n=1 Tax=Pleurodeles waltl TaxID=8319 RepID=A0AAV7WDT9_PLEWA|nr:hypothetical protein NDU88_005829 [Pleurodeles waltl]
MNRVVRINDVVRPESSIGGKSSSDSESGTQSDSLCGDTREGDVWCITLSVPREDGFHGDAVRESSGEPRGKSGSRKGETVGGGDK